VTIFQRESNWPQAAAALKRAEVLLAGQGGSATLQRRTDGLRRDLDMASELEEIRLRATASRAGDTYWGTGFEYDLCDTDYHKAFRAYGVDLEANDPEQAAALIRAQAIRQELVAALDHWARLLIDNQAKKENRDRLLRIARLADSDDWRNQVRLAITEGNVDDLKALAAVACLILMLTEVAARDKKVPIGSQAEKFTFKDIHYLPRTLDDFGHPKAYVFVFTTAGCPLA
jgi:hypothetical protein